MRRLQRPASRQLSVSSRHGSMAPVAMMGLVAVIAATGLTVDRLWLDAAQVELTSAAESAALRGGRLLAGDERLQKDPNWSNQLRLARAAAADIAYSNLIAGAPVELDQSEDADIRFGRLVRRQSEGKTVFVETETAPTSVVVHAEHSRSRQNPVARFFDGWASTSGGDVVARAEASVDNRIAALQPLNGVPIPVLPMAILRHDTESCALRGWDDQIEQRNGSDEFRFDEQSGKVIEEPDGIPEMLLRSTEIDGDPLEANVHLFAIAPHASLSTIVEHVQRGWLDRDLPDDLNPLRLDRGSIDFEALSGFNGSIPSELARLVGEPRIVFLFDSYESIGSSEGGRVRCVGAVAARIMSIAIRGDGLCQMIVQPTVLTTRTAVLGSETVTDGDWDRLANRYIYKLQLTY